MSPRTPNITKGRYTTSAEHPPTDLFYQKTEIKNKRKKWLVLVISVSGLCSAFAVAAPRLRQGFAPAWCKRNGRKCARTNHLH